METSDLDVVVAGTEDLVNMIEAGAREANEDDVLKAIDIAQDVIRQQCAMQKQLAEEAGKPKREVMLVTVPGDVLAVVREKTAAELRSAVQNPDKAARESGLSELKDEIVERLAPEFDDPTVPLDDAVDKVVKEQVRSLILDEGIRPDGRRLDEIRPITCEVGLLPRCHGSGLFTRGQTQVLTTVTLGSADDVQQVDGLEATSRSGTCTSTTSHPIPWVRRARCADPAGGRSVTAVWQRRRCWPSFRRARSSLTRFS